MHHVHAEAAKSIRIATEKTYNKQVMTKMKRKPDGGQEPLACPCPICLDEVKENGII
jgi:hypothetical protein